MSKKSTADDERVAVPGEFFDYCGSATKDGNSMYKCKNCSTGVGGKKISCSDKSRLNLKKHIEVYAYCSSSVSN